MGMVLHWYQGIDTVTTGLVTTDKQGTFACAFAIVAMLEDNGSLEDILLGVFESMVLSA